MLCTQFTIAQSLEALHSFTDPEKSFAAHAWFSRSLQPGFLFPSEFGTQVHTTLTLATARQRWLSVKAPPPPIHPCSKFRFHQLTQFSLKERYSLSVENLWLYVVPPLLACFSPALPSQLEARTFWEQHPSFTLRKSRISQHTFNVGVEIPDLLHPHGFICKTRETMVLFSRGTRGFIFNKLSRRNHPRKTPTFYTKISASKLRDVFCVWGYKLRCVCRKTSMEGRLDFPDQKLGWRYLWLR